MVDGRQFRKCCESYDLFEIWNADALLFQNGLEIYNVTHQERENIRLTGVLKSSATQGEPVRSIVKLTQAVSHIAWVFR